MNKPKKTFKVRPYHGYDCNSYDGFNNGHYLDSILVDASSEQDAIDKAMDLYIKEQGLDMDKIQRDSEFGDNTLYSAGPTTDENGNDVDTEADDFEFDETKHGYTYQYIDFNEVEENENE